ncbi:hypothetical protein ASZ90_009816 [hydrocarbon metagenome]|uniref:STAS/SEC14 domain-containing protein n=1 Tax=hydrocarbon metagenome TaxID=938273 RepID=A0A0W8FHT0_9ZZZZ|nr:STAS/SEC14 domain-containing protein [Methanomicrobiaceae archaeon]
MFEKMEINGGNVLGFRAIGTLTEADYREVVVPEMDRAIEKHGSIRLLVKIEDFQGWTPGGAWEDFKQFQNLKHIERMAVVGDENWEGWMSGLLKFFTVFTEAEIRFFKEERIGDAVAWVQQKPGPKAATAAPG